MGETSRAWLHPSVELHMRYLKRRSDNLESQVHVFARAGLLLPRSCQASTWFRSFRGHCQPGHVAAEYLKLSPCSPTFALIKIPWMDRLGSFYA